VKCRDLVEFFAYRGGIFRLNTTFFAIKAEKMSKNPGSTFENRLKKAKKRHKTPKNHPKYLDFAANIIRKSTFWPYKERKVSSEDFLQKKCKACLT